MTTLLELEVKVGQAEQDVKGLADQLARMEKEGNDAAGAADKVSKSTNTMASSVARFAKGVVAGFSVGLFAKTAIANTIAQERAIASVESTLKSTGNAAGLTAEQLARTASELQSVTTHADDAILDMQALLLTFTNVTGNTFNAATETILNMSDALKTDLKGATLQVGKALNDPIAGVSALAEAGIQFNDEQKDTIKGLVQSGKLMEAQGVILTELERQFGGTARAMRDTLGGAVHGLQNAFGDLLESPRSGLNTVKEAVEDLTAVVSDPAVVNAFQGLASGAVTLMSWMATSIAVVVNTVSSTVGTLQDTVSAAVDFVTGYTNLQAQVLTGLQLQLHTAKQLEDQAKGRSTYAEEQATRYNKILSDQVKRRGELLAQGKDIAAQDEAIADTRARMAGNQPFLVADQKAAVEASDAVAELENQLNNVATVSEQITLPSLEDINAALTKMEKQSGKTGIALVEKLTPFQQMLADIEEDVLRIQEIPDLVNKLDAMFFSGEISETVWAMAMDRTVGKIEEAKTATKDFSESFQGEMKDVALDAVGGLEDALVDMITTGKMSFKSLIDSIIADLARLLIRQAITKPLEGFINGVTPSAQGNVIQGQNIIPHAKGGIIPSPIAFPLSTGIGTAAETKPEIIMPAIRMPNGNMGVETSGSGINQTNNFYVQGEMSDQSQRQLSADLGRATSRAMNRGY